MMISNFEFELTSSGTAKHISLTEKESRELYSDLKAVFDNSSSHVPNSILFPKGVGDKSRGEIQSTYFSDESLEKLKDLPYCQKYHTMNNSEYGC